MTSGGQMGKGANYGERRQGNFPTGAVVILALCTTLHCYTYVSLFPYIGFMVKHLLRLETTNEAGYYAGYVASSFTLGRFMSSYALGHATDAFGRKPVIVLGLLSIMVFSLAFGLSSSYTFALSSRLLLGLFNGIMPAVRTSMREICGPEHIGIGMTYVAGCKSASLVLGTGIGGLLAQPAAKYPSAFSEAGLFGRFPFLLPNLVGSFCALVLIPLVIFYFPETKGLDNLVGRMDDVDTSSSASKAAIVQSTGPLLKNPPGSYHSFDASTGKSAHQTVFNAAGELSQQRPGIDKTYLTSGKTGDSSKGAAATSGDGPGDNMLECDATSDDELGGGLCGLGGLISFPNVKIVLFIGMVFQVVYVGFEDAYPLWALSTPDVGGLGWGTMEIGKVLIVAGLIMGVYHLVLSPPAIKLLGIVTWQRIGSLLTVPAFVSIPWAASLSWDESSLFAYSVASTTLVLAGFAMFNLALVVATTSMVPANMRGKLSGLFGMAENLGRILGPPGYAVTFAWSISPSSAYDWVDYRFVFYASATVMLMLTAVGWKSLAVESLMLPAKGGDDDDTDAVHVVPVPVVDNGHV